MTSQELDANFARLKQAIESQEDKPPTDAMLNIAKAVIGDLGRIADALDHIARNTPAKKDDGT